MILIEYRKDCEILISTHVFAHRGSAGTHPENTMSAFREAERVGAEGIELDVQLSKDGEVVVIHDEELSRTTNGTGFVKDHTLNELKKLNASYTFSKQVGIQRIPTLAEVLDMFTHNNMLLNIELKNSTFLYPGMEEKVIALVRKYNMQNRVILSSFNHYSLVHCFQLDPSIETAPLYQDGLFRPWVYAKAIGARAIHPNIKAAPNILITAAMNDHIAVRPYTVNKEKVMKRLFDINCTSFITDFPEKAIILRNTINKQKDM